MQPVRLKYREIGVDKRANLIDDSVGFMQNGHMCLHFMHPPLL